MDCTGNLFSTLPWEQFKMVKEAYPRKWREVQERSHVLWLGVWTFILKSWNRKLARLIVHVWALIAADLKSRCAFPFSFLWTWGLLFSCPCFLCPPIFVLSVWSHEHRYSHTIFPNTIFKFTMIFFLRTEKRLHLRKKKIFPLYFYPIKNYTSAGRNGEEVSKSGSIVTSALDV